MDKLEAYDLGTLYWFGSLHGNTLTPIVKAITFLGSLWFLWGLGLISTLLFLRLGRRRVALGFAIICLLAPAVEHGVKAIVQRPRPEVAWRLIPLPNNPSFPSGHALNSMAILCSAGILLGSLARRRLLAWVLVGGAIVLASCVGSSRAYLGVHYPLDVIGGWLAGLGIALTGTSLIAIAERRPPPAAREMPTALPAG